MSFNGKDEIQTGDLDIWKNKAMSNAHELKAWVICKTALQKMISLSDATLAH